MQESRSKNSIRNIFWSVIKILSIIIFPFIFRTLILRELGEGILGATTLYRSLVEVLNVTELGLTSAIGASLYRPISENNEEEICALLKMYRKLYFVIASVIFVVGLVLTPFLKYISKNTLPVGSEIYFLWVLYLADSAIGYFLFPYNISLIEAHQRKDITEKVELIIRLFQFSIQYFVIVKLHSIIIYELLKIGYTVCLNLGCKFVSNKRYPNLYPKGELKPEMKNKIFENIKSVACQKIGTTVSFSIDTVIISSFMGLTIVAKYGNYNMVFHAIMALIDVIGISIVASVGNSIVSNTIDTNYDNFKKLAFLFFWIVGWCSVCFLCLFQDFISVWVGDKMLFRLSIVITLVMRFYFDKIRVIGLTYKDALGLWKNDKWRPIVGCIINLLLNIILIKWYGVAGVAIATVIVFAIIELPWETHTLFSSYFKRSPIEYYLEMIMSMITVLISGFVTWFICSRITFQGIWALLAKACVCVMVFNFLFVVLNVKNCNLHGAKEMLLGIKKSVKR